MTHDNLSQYPENFRFNLGLLFFTLVTLAMFPVLVSMYVRLARSEEAEAGFGEAYEHYKRATPAFFPRLGMKLP